jgi:hypothetical protein
LIEIRFAWWAQQPVSSQRYVYPAAPLLFVRVAYLVMGEWVDRRQVPVLFVGQVGKRTSFFVILIGCEKI